MALSIRPSDQSIRQGCNNGAFCDLFPSPRVKQATNVLHDLFPFEHRLLWFRWLTFHVSYHDLLGAVLEELSRTMSDSRHQIPVQLRRYLTAMPFDNFTGPGVSSCLGIKSREERMHRSSRVSIASCRNTSPKAEPNSKVQRIHFIYRLYASTVDSSVTNSSRWFTAAGFPAEHGTRIGGRYFLPSAAFTPLPSR